jgi:hypothetical protein
VRAAKKKAKNDEKEKEEGSGGAGMGAYRVFVGRLPLVVASKPSLHTRLEKEETMATIRQ